MRSSSSSFAGLFKIELGMPILPISCSSPPWRRISSSSEDVYKRQALCWVHAERTINKLIGINTKATEEIEEVRGNIWDFYAALKDYKKDPSKQQKVLLEKRFDEIFTAKPSCVSLKLALQRLHNNKKELLLVLEHPDIPLHNNLSENDIREYVKKRKISGSTRSDSGRRCRDTFTSLKKTCRKLGISFWEYLQDRVSHKNTIARLPDIIRSHTS